MDGGIIEGVSVPFWTQRENVSIQFSVLPLLGVLISI